MTIDLINVLHDSNLTQGEKTLAILFYLNKPSTLRSIKALATENGLHKASKWNFSQILFKLQPLAVNLKDGWIITDNGVKKLEDLGVIVQSPTSKIEPVLRNHLNEINNLQIKSFVEEAVKALELGLFRSAVVLSWVGAIAVLQEFVLNKYLNDFNQAANEKLSKWKNAKSTDDISKMKEFDFLLILNNLSIIGKNVKDELEKCLKLRNACGHPNSLELSEHMVAAHIEVLILNVYAKFSV